MPSDSARKRQCLFVWIRSYSARGPIGCGVRLTLAGVAARAHARGELERRGILGTLTLVEASVNREGHAWFTAPSLPTQSDDCLGDLDIASKELNFGATVVARPKQCLILRVSV